MRVNLRLPDDWSLGTIAGVVGDEFVADRPRAVRVLYLDTFDWRFAATGGRLTEEVADDERRLRWVETEGDPPVVLPVQAAIRFARELPASILRSRLESLAGIRAILPFGESHVIRWAGRLRDANGNTTALIQIERATPVDESGTPAGPEVSTIEAFGIPGFQGLFGELVTRLRDVTGGTDGPDLLEVAANIRGRSIGDYSSKLDLRLDPRQRADEALRSILGHLASTLRANVDGIIADHDTEFLHDFRVATRRTRAALTQLKGVLPEETISTFRDEFRWLGSLTGECRDLDVYLLEMGTFRSLLGQDADTLDALERVVERARSLALDQVRTGLESARFERLLGRWGEFLEAPTPEETPPRHANRPIGRLASRKILKAFRRMTKHGQGLGETSAGEELHRLRIDGKKLRYLLEFFRSLYDDREVARLIKAQKQLQDILGGINDLAVQRRRLADFAHELAGDVDTLLAMGRLTFLLQQREEQTRHQFAQAFASFASPKSCDRYQSLFGSAEGG